MAGLSLRLPVDQSGPEWTRVVLDSRFDWWLYLPPLWWENRGDQTPPRMNITHILDVFGSSLITVGVESHRVHEALTEHGEGITTAWRSVLVFPSAAVSLCDITNTSLRSGLTGNPDFKRATSPRDAASGSNRGGSSSLGLSGLRLQADVWDQRRSEQVSFKASVLQ